MSLYKSALAIVLGLTVALAGCSKKEPKFEKTTKTIELTIVIYSSEREAVQELDGRVGMAVWSPNDNKCTVHFAAGDMETAGHELHHCVYGSFHSEVDR